MTKTNHASVSRHYHHLQHRLALFQTLMRSLTRSKDEHPDSPAKRQLYRESGHLQADVSRSLHPLDLQSNCGPWHFSFKGWS